MLGGALWATVGNSSPSRHLGSLASARTSSTSAAQCSPAHLSLATHPLDAALSGSYTRYTITNTGTTTCAIGGVPTLGWRSATSSSSTAFPQTAGRTVASGTFTLAPGSQASFWVFYPVCMTITSAEAAPGNLEVSLPEMSGTLSLKQGTPDCDQNEVTVAAVQPGVVKTAPGFTTTPESTPGPVQNTPTKPKANLETTPYSERVYP